MFHQPTSVIRFKGRIRVQEAIDGQLITTIIETDPKITGDNAVSDTERDILKLVVKKRYKRFAPSLGFIHGFWELKEEL